MPRHLRFTPLFVVASLWSLPAPAMAQADPSGGTPLGVVSAAADVAAATGGVLEVTTDVPGAQVALDGANVGVTPLRLENLRAGPHQLVVSGPLGGTASRAVTIRDGGHTLVDLTLPAPAAPTAGVAPADKGAVGAAWKNLGLSFLQLPWAALAVGTTFGLFLTCAVLLTTKPADVPFLEDSTLRVSDGQWRAAAVTAGLLGVVVGGAAVVLLVLRLEPVDRVVDLLKAMTDKGQDKGAAR